MEMAQLIPSNSFANYLARKYVAYEGYKPVILPETAELQAASDIVLTFIDGFHFKILCIIDHTLHPEKRFEIPPLLLQAIAGRCLKYTGRVGRNKIPITVTLIEIGEDLPSTEDQLRLKAHKKIPTGNDEVVVRVWAVATEPKEVWSPAMFNGLMIGRGFIERALREPPLRTSEMDAHAGVVFKKDGFPVVTYILLVMMAVVLLLEAHLSARHGGSIFSVDMETLAALGAANKTIIFHNRIQFYRLLSAAFLHAGIFHFLMNAIVLIYAGKQLERIVGGLWYAAIFMLGAVGGSAMGLVLNSSNTVSVGASGAIMALLAALYVVSFRIPPGSSGRTQLQRVVLQMLILSLIPVKSVSGLHIDLAAHLGGALTGGLIGWLLLRVWPHDQPLPRYGGLAMVVYFTGICLLLHAVIMAQFFYLGH